MKAISQITVLSDISAEITTVLTAEFNTAQVFFFEIFEKLEIVLSAEGKFMVATALVSLDIAKVTDVKVVFTELFSEITEIDLEMVFASEIFVSFQVSVEVMQSVVKSGVDISMISVEKFTEFSQISITEIKMENIFALLEISEEVTENISIEMQELV